MMQVPSGIDLNAAYAPRRLRDFSVIAFDMDSTLVNIETLDEIAVLMGLGCEVAAITEATMRGDLPDYKASLRQRVALLRGTPTHVLQTVYDERLRLNEGAERLISACKSAGLHCILISGGFTFFTERLQQRLGLDDAHANVAEVNQGCLTGRLLPQAWGDICDGPEKRRKLLAYCAALGVDSSRAIAIGDGENDIPMLEAAGLSVAYHGKPRVRDRAMVSIQSGGLDRILEIVD